MTTDIIEIEIARLPQDGMQQHAELLAMARLTPLEDGGYYVYVKSGADQTFWESRGFLATRAGEDIWRLAKRTLAWAAAEAEKRS